MTPLTLDDNLSWFAQWRADDLASRSDLHHELPNGGFIFDVLSGVGYPYRVAGENIGRCVCSVAQMEAALEASPEHNANITDPRFHRLGLGISYSPTEIYYVELFAD